MLGSVAQAILVSISMMELTWYSCRWVRRWAMPENGAWRLLIRRHSCSAACPACCHQDAGLSCTDTCMSPHPESHRKGEALYQVTSQLYLQSVLIICVMLVLTAGD